MEPHVSMCEGATLHNSDTSTPSTNAKAARDGKGQAYGSELLGIDGLVTIPLSKGHLATIKLLAPRVSGQT